MTQTKEELRRLIREGQIAREKEEKEKKEARKKAMISAMEMIRLKNKIISELRQSGIITPDMKSSEIQEIINKEIEKRGL